MDGGVIASEGLVLRRSGMDPRHSPVAPLPHEVEDDGWCGASAPISNVDDETGSGADHGASDRGFGESRKLHHPRPRERAATARNDGLYEASAPTSSAGGYVEDSGNVHDLRGASKVRHPRTRKERSDCRVSGIHSGTVTSPRRCRTSHATSLANRGCGHRQDLRP